MEVPDNGGSTVPCIVQQTVNMQSLQENSHAIARPQQNPTTNKVVIKWPYLCRITEVTIPEAECRVPEEVRHACTNHYKFSAFMSLRSHDNIQANALNL